MIMSNRKIQYTITRLYRITPVHSSHSYICR